MINSEKKEQCWEEIDQKEQIVEEKKKHTKREEIRWCCERTGFVVFGNSSRETREGKYLDIEY